MTNETQQARRAAFEKAMEAMLVSEGYTPRAVPSIIARGADGEYQTIRINGAWYGFNTALDSILIELPLRAHDGWHDYDQGYNAAHSECRDAIHAAGVKTK